MSQQDSHLWKRVEELFHQAEQRPEAGRDAWVDGQMGESEEVRREVKALLAGLAIHERRCQEPAPDAPSPEAPTLARYGPYQTVRMIGQGGMGAVYLATRVDGQFQQTVALKTIAPHLASSDFLRRFQIERQLLATLVHPNIPRLLDGGVSSAGDPYLVMEFIDGQSIERYCDEKKLGVRERLAIVLQVASAVDYAHRNLVVHRDLKPANILVDAGGNAKLLDFGTASLLEGTGSVTATRVRMLTPRYASPEQLRGERVNTSTDIYSLGIVLYELLTGAWPFGDPESLVAELNRATGKASAMPMATVVTEAAAGQRAASRQTLAQSLKGDLSAIAMKALESEPAQRYSSVREFADDIQNFLEGKPVLAQPQTALYRAGKFVRRRWFLVSGVAIFALGITLAALIAIYQARLARDRYADLRVLTTSLLFELKDAINDIPGATKAQQILVNRVVKNLDKLSQFSSDRELQMELSEAFRQLGELQGDPYVQNLNDTKGALESLAKAKSIADRVATPDAAWLRLAGLIEADVGEVYFGMGQSGPGLEHLKASVAYFDRMFPLTQNAIWQGDAAAAHGSLGDLYGQPGTPSLRDVAKAAEQYKHVISLDEIILKNAPDTIRARRGMALMQMKLGDLLRHADPASAVEYFERAAQAMETLPPEDLKKPVNQRYRASFLRKKGGALTDLNQWDAAEHALQQSVNFDQSREETDPNDSRAVYDLVVSLNDLDEMLIRRGDNERALAVTERALQLSQKLLETARTNPVWLLNVAGLQCSRGTLLARLGRTQEALPASQAGLAGFAKLAADPKAPPSVLMQAAEAYRSVEPEQLRDPSRAMTLAKRNLMAGQDTEPYALYLLAMAQQAAGQTQQARETAAKALTIIAPPRGKLVSYMRVELEAIR